MIRTILISMGAIVAGVLLIGLLVLFFQGKARPDTSGQYVALGSSFAAGIGLGPRAPGSPFVCMRSTGGYPRLLAKMAGLTLVDMSCSGSTTSHILHGGQVFLGPQLAAIGPKTRLVTITSGGNDVGYIGDLMMEAGSVGGLGKLFWKGPEPLAERDFVKVTSNLRAIVEAIGKRAPEARIVLVSYPTVLPAEGSCAALGIEPRVANLSREVAARLLAATRAAAEQAGAIFVDMAAEPGHDACAAVPWVNGAKPGSGTAFHPNGAGAEATAEAIFKALFPDARPAGA